MNSYVMIGVLIAAVVALWFVLHVYNRLVRAHNQVRNAWSDIDVQLTFRHDLVPNLVNAVKGYVAHEREALESAAQARAAAMMSGADIATRAASEMALSGAVGSLLAVAERYPELKASHNFQLLQEQLTTTENRIAFACQRYNETVRQFNTLIAEFPWNLLAAMMGRTPEKMFAAKPQDRAAVRIAI